MRQGIVTICLIALCYCSVLAQKTYTYSGVYDNGRSYEEGKATYQYVIINGEKVKHGSFSFTSSTLVEKGNYYYGKKHGLWTFQQHYQTLAGMYVAKQNIRMNVITEAHNYREVTEISNMNYNKGNAHGLYNETVTSVQKWWYTVPGSYTFIKKRNGEYNNNKRVSQTGSYTENGIRQMYFNANYINDKINGIVTIQTRDQKTVYHTKKGAILKSETTNFSSGKVEKENFKIDSSLYSKLNSKNKGYSLIRGMVKLLIDSFPNTNKVRYKFIYKKSHNYDLTGGFYDLNKFFPDTIGNAYYDKYYEEKYPLLKFDFTDNYQFDNLDDEYLVMNQYFKQRDDITQPYTFEYRIKDYEAHKKLTEEEELYALKYDTANIKRDTIWRIINELGLRNLIANTDTVSLRQLKTYPDFKQYDALFYELMWGYLKNLPDTGILRYNYVVASNNNESSKAIEDAKLLLKFFKTKSNFRIFDSIAKSLDNIEYQRNRYNEKIKLANDSVLTFKTQIWNYKPIRLHLTNKAIYENWWDEFYYTLDKEVLNVCPTDFNIPTIEDIEYNFQADDPLLEFFKDEKETYFSYDSEDDPESTKHGHVMIVRDFKTNKLNFYSLTEKKIIKEGIYSSKVRCVYNR